MGRGSKKNISHEVRKKRHKRRAIVIGSGGFFGAYDAGVLAAIRDHIRFEAVYTSSVGAFTGAFFAAKQFNVIERVWKNAVGGKFVFRPVRALKKKSALDLDRILGWCREGETRLRFKRISASGVHLIFTLTEYPSGRAVYRTAADETIFSLMKASAAIPFLTRPVTIGGIRYVDSAFVDPLPFEKAIEDGYDEVVVISNKPEGFVPARLEIAAAFVAEILRSPLARLIKNYKWKFADVAGKLRPRPGLYIIRPATRLPLKGFLDTNQERIRRTFEQGKEDGKKFLATHAFMFGVSSQAYRRTISHFPAAKDLYRKNNTPLAFGEEFAKYACVLGLYLTAILSPLPALNFGVTVSEIWIF